MVVLTVFDFIGSLHPVLVHLPIGILLLGCFFQLLTSHKRFAIVQSTIPLIYLLGAIGAVFSSISGYMLSQSEDYDPTIVNIHQWLGISVAAVSLTLYFIYKVVLKKIWRQLMAVSLAILITLAGHYGGTLTHGSDYLTAALKSEQRKEAIPIIANVQEAVVYSDIVQPLLQNRCYSCHGSEKQKGKLRLDTRDFMLKGGEEGVALVPGNVEESEMIRRLLLPVSNEYHMPPKEKPQLTEKEVKLLEWWIRSGADIHKKVGDFPQQDDVADILLDLEQEVETDQTVEPSSMLSQEVPEADASVIEELRQEGVVLLPIVNNSNYLSASFVTAEVTTDLLEKLVLLKRQLVYLDLSYASIDDEAIAVAANFDNLLRINLSNTAISDAGLQYLSKLKHLKYINLVRTKVTAQGVIALKNMPDLKNVYLYESAVDKKDSSALNEALGMVNIDFGGYEVPTLMSDTSEVKIP
ncbi:hypothetical protein H8S90_03085 [Olivibacter sp. SDN3]|uniref:c-type cytochrome domain-containing protein n=1 Tax=Olivibacter sp. SDN3 TaxID=2764720 RepID=UPI001650F02F|nr:c-type cytochrome domain-containing protein [Olivibacter sp. SDN3]QNL50605.1 hypothetical protein H8S90_03085 [Olivibacter sp. SDN3]